MERFVSFIVFPYISIITILSFSVNKIFFLKSLKILKKDKEDFKSPSLETSRVFQQAYQT